MASPFPDDPHAARRRLRPADLVLIGLLLAAIAAALWLAVPPWLVVLLLIVLVTAVVATLGNAGVFDRRQTPRG